MRYGDEARGGVELSEEDYPARSDEGWSLDAGNRVRQAASESGGIPLVGALHLYGLQLRSYQAMRHQDIIGFTFTQPFGGYYGYEKK